jgi:hypothetical protein
MAVEVSIGGMRRNLTEVTEGWIRDEIGRGRAGGQDVCVLVSIETARIHINLATRSCSLGGGVCSLNPLEHRIVELWTSCGLNEYSFEASGVVAFLHKLRALAGSELRACA